MENTLTILKPDAIRRNLTGSILKIIQEKGFKIIALKMLKFSLEDAQKFYEIHSSRPFFNDLCKFMTSGPICAAILEKKDAVKELRELMGATNPAQSSEGTLRKLFGISIDENSIHGSDSCENAQTEMHLLFNKNEIFA